ncbi:MAG: G-D-S-L family lipolytic protein [Synechococcaceae cyanobacterium RL_1_2]|nr:G-D-S-L family lipolytic protein [Synechococcaceae cyanobacterium RL_1_2]
MTALSFSAINPSFLSPQQLRVLALGDSLVYGFGDPVRGGWVEQLRLQWMGSHPGHILYNLGVRGDTVQQVQQRLEQEFQRRGELRNKQPDLLLLSVGVNDSARLGRPDGKNYTDVNQFHLHIAQLLDRAQNLAEAMFIGMVPVNESKMPFLDCFYFNHADQFRYQEIIKQACHDRGIPYLDIFDLWLSRGTDWVNDHLCPDGVHPNTDGYSMLFQDISNWQAIAQLTPALENLRECLENIR